MANSKLYKNGNSTVVAIPPWVLDFMQLKPGAELRFHVPKGDHDEVLPVIIVSKPETHAKPKTPTHR